MNDVAQEAWKGRKRKETPNNEEMKDESTNLSHRRRADHRFDAALYRLALEKGFAGAAHHGVADEVSTRARSCLEQYAVQHPARPTHVDQSHGHGEKISGPSKASREATMMKERNGPILRQPKRSDAPDDLSPGSFGSQR
jgi:hypothetical protein